MIGLIDAGAVDAVKGYTTGESRAASVSTIAVLAMLEVFEGEGWLGWRREAWDHKSSSDE